VNDPISCSTTDSSGACADVAPPGTGFTCTCSAGFVVDTTTPSSPTCTYRDCGAPSVQTGYTFNSGTTYYTSTRTATCASGYSGTATSITCGANGQWSASAGCTLNCSTSPTQTNYVIATGASNQGATRTVTCGSGYSGTASSITCGTNSAWSISSGCTLNCSTSPTQTGYTVSAAPATKAPPGLPRAQAATQALVLRSLANPTVHGPRPQAAPSIVTRLRKPVTPSLAEVLIKGPRAPLPALLAILALLRRLPAEPTQFGQLLRAAPPL